MVQQCSLTDSSTLTLGTVLVEQNLNLVAGGTISDSGDLSITGTSTFDNSGVGSASNITLNNSNTFGGDVTITTHAGSDVTINDSDAFAIQSGLNVNNLSITVKELQQILILLIWMAR